MGIYGINYRKEGNLFPNMGDWLWSKLIYISTYSVNDLYESCKNYVTQYNLNVTFSLRF
jgi:hypothetical protein